MFFGELVLFTNWTPVGDMVLVSVQLCSFAVFFFQKYEKQNLKKGWGEDLLTFVRVMFTRSQFFSSPGIGAKRAYCDHDFVLSFFCKQIHPCAKTKNPPRSIFNWPSSLNQNAHRFCSAQIMTQIEEIFEFDCLFARINTMTF